MKKKIMIVLLCFVAVIGGLLLWGYQYMFHNLDEETKSRIDQEIGTITDQVNERIQAEKDSLNLDDEEGAGEDGQSQREESDGARPVLSAEVSQVVSQGVDSLTWKAASILEIYFDGMETLSDEGNAIVNQMLSNAKEDYKKIKAAGGGKQDLVSLASAYSNQASAMESGIDASVESLLSQLSQDLTDQGVASGDVKAITEQLRKEYKKQKSERYDEIMAKYKKMIE